MTPAGLLQPTEIPDWAGLIEIDGNGHKYVIHAPLRDKDAPSWQFVVSLIRNSGKVNRDTDLLKQRLRHAEKQLRDVTNALKREGLQPWQFGVLS